MEAGLLYSDLERMFWAFSPLGDLLRAVTALVVVLPAGEATTIHLDGVEGWYLRYERSSFARRGSTQGKERSGLLKVLSVSRVYRS